MTRAKHVTRDKLAKEIVALLAGHSTNVHRPAEDDDIIMALNLTDDQLAAFLRDYAAQFDVDMTGYLEYFHFSPDAAPATPADQLPYLPNGQKAQPLPITLGHLVDAATQGRWHCEYPNHHLQKVGWKDLFQYGLIAGVAIWIVLSFFL